jgi:hypothetical protein
LANPLPLTDVQIKNINRLKNATYLQFYTGTSGLEYVGTIDGYLKEFDKTAILSLINSQAPQTITATIIDSALGYIPYNSTNPSGYISTIAGITAGGDLTGTYPNPTLNNTGTSGNYNNINTDAQGRVMSGSLISYLTANQTITISGDGSGTGATTIAFTLATVNSNIGTWNNVTVNDKGLVIGGSNVSYLTGNQIITLNGNITGSGTTSITTTIGSGIVTNTMLVNSSLTIGSTSVSLGATVTTFAGVILTSPTFTTPTLGTPASGVLTNCTGYTYGNLSGSVPTWNQNTTGNATTASNMSGGAAGEIPYQTGSGTSGFSAAGSSGQALISGGTSAPTWYAPTASQMIFAGTSGILTSDASLTYSTSSGMITTKQYSNSYAGTASNSAIIITGTPFAGNGTTSWPIVFISNETPASYPTGWSTSGTFLGIVPHSGFSGNIISIVVANVKKFTIDASGNTTIGGGTLIATSNTGHTLADVKFASVSASSMAGNQGSGGYIDLQDSVSATYKLSTATGSTGQGFILSANLASSNITGNIYQIQKGTNTVWGINNRGFINYTGSDVINGFAAFNGSGLNGWVGAGSGPYTLTNASGNGLVDVYPGDRVAWSSSNSSATGTYSTVTAVTNTVITTIGANSTSTGYLWVKKALGSWWDSAGVSRMIISDQGYVGISTVNPLSYLHINTTVIASANVGTISVGGGAFDGATTGYFTGSSNGTHFAVNSISGSTADYENYQKNGVKFWLVDTNGCLSVRSGASGTNKPSGTGALVGGTATISNSLCVSTSIILIVDTSASTTNVGSLTVVAGSGSFVVTSVNPLDTSTFAYFIINTL